jgi:hypothetical protein
MQKEECEFNKMVFFDGINDTFVGVKVFDFGGKKLQF